MGISLCTRQSSDGGPRTDVNLGFTITATVFNYGPFTGRDKQRRVSHYAGLLNRYNVLRTLSARLDARNVFASTNC